MKRRTSVDEFGLPVLDLFTEPHSRPTPIFSIYGDSGGTLPKAKLTSCAKHLVDFVVYLGALISVVGLLILPPILAIPATHLARWIVKTLESLATALKSTVRDLMTTIESYVDVIRRD